MSRPNFPPPPPPSSYVTTTGTSLYMAVGVGVSSMLVVGVISLGVVLALEGRDSQSHTQLAANSEMVDAVRPAQQESPPVDQTASASSENPQGQQRNPVAPGNADANVPPSSNDTVSTEAGQTESVNNTSPPANNPEPKNAGNDLEMPSSEPVNPPPRMSSSQGRPLDAVRALQNVLRPPLATSNKTPVKLVELNIKAEELKDLELDLSSAFSEDQTITTKKLTTLSPPTWEVSVQGAGSLGQARHDATFTATSEGLMFNWERSSPHRNILFSPLKLAFVGGGERDEEVCKLFAEIPLDPLKLTFDKPTKTLSINTSDHALPEIDSLLLRVEFEGLGEDAKLKSASRVPSGTPVEIILPDPDFTEEPLLAFDVKFQEKNKNIEIEIAQFLNHDWVNKSTYEPELVKHPLDLEMFPKLKNEADQLTKVLSRKVEREIEGKLALLESRTRSQANNDPNVTAQINELLDQRDKYESAILAMNGLSQLEEIVLEECKRLEQAGILRLYFETIPDHTKPDQTIVVIKSK